MSRCGVFGKVFSSWLGAVLVFLLVFALYALSVNAVFYTSYTVGAMALARGIASGSPYVDQRLCFSGWADTVFVGGRCVFAGPLGLGIALVLPMRLSDIFGVSDLVFAGFAMAFLGTLAVYISMELYKTLFGGRGKAVAVAIANGLAGPLYIYSTHVFPQAPLTLFYVLHMLSLVRLLSGGGGEWAVLAGFSASMSIVLDPSTSISIAFASAFVFWGMARGSRKSVSRVLTHAFLYIASASPAILAQLVYNMLTTGDMLVFPEQVYLERLGIEGFNPANIPYGLFVLLIDFRKSLLALYPLYIVSIIYMPKMLKSMDRKAKVLYLASIAIPVTVYSSWYDADGGLCYGPRFLTTVTPLLAAPLALAMESRAGLAALASLSIYSLAENIIVVMSTPYPSALEYLEPFENQLISSIKQFGKGVRSALIYTILSHHTDNLTATAASIAILAAIALTQAMAVAKLVHSPCQRKTG